MRQLEMRESKGQLLAVQCLRPVNGSIHILRIAIGVILPLEISFMYQNDCSFPDFLLQYHILQLPELDLLSD